MLVHKSASLISAMEDCKKPLHSIVFVITEHSKNLYKSVHDLKMLSKHQPPSLNEMIDIPSSDIDNLCYCTVGTKTA